MVNIPITSRELSYISKQNVMKPFFCNFCTPSDTSEILGNKSPSYRLVAVHGAGRPGTITENSAVKIQSPGVT